MESLENDLDDDVSYTDVIHNPAPCWLQLELPHCVPSFWMGPIMGFISVAVAVLEPDPPESALLHARLIDQSLEFEVAIDPRLERNFDLQALKNAADAFGSMAAQIASAHRQSVPKSPSTDGYPSDNRQCDSDWTEAPVVGHKKNKGFEEKEAAMSTSKVNDVPIFNWKKNTQKDGGREIGRDGDASRRMLNTIQALKRTGHTRPLCPPPPDWKAKVNDLVEKFPNFSEVVKIVVQPHLMMLEKNEPHRFSPILLVGQPGSGKTFFANALAQTLGLRNAMFVSMAEETNGSALNGSSIFWANSSPGRLFETLAWGDDLTPPPANPLLILDEIDKINVDHNNPIAALYALLEEDTSKSFKDASLPDLTIDTRHLRVVCTANTVELIPGPLLSRMVVFHVEPPSAAQMRGVVRTIYSGLISRLKTPMQQELPDEVIQLALKLNARETKVRLECAVACAISKDRDHILPSDWPDVPSAIQQTTRRGIGFTA